MDVYCGAEAVIKREGKRIIKERLPKTYRHELLDKRLIKERNRTEINILKKLYSRGVNVPKVLSEGDNFIEMEYIEGITLYEVNSLSESIIESLSSQISAMHNMNIVHGDLTLRNIILSSSHKVYIIDFGLAYHSSRYEDKAMDLYVLEETSRIKDFPMDVFLEKYFQNVRGAEHIKERLEKIRKRRRYLGGA